MFHEVKESHFCILLSLKNDILCLSGQMDIYARSDDLQDDVGDSSHTGRSE